MVSIVTGKNHSPEELIKHEPDILLEDLIDTKKVLHILNQL
jgi:hypothetical protein